MSRSCFIIPSQETVQHYVQQVFNAEVYPDYTAETLPVEKFHQGPASDYHPFVITASSEGEDGLLQVGADGTVSVELSLVSDAPHQSFYDLPYRSNKFNMTAAGIEATRQFFEESDFYRVAYAGAANRFLGGVLEGYLYFLDTRSNIVTGFKIIGLHHSETEQKFPANKPLLDPATRVDIQLRSEEVWSASDVDGRTNLKVSRPVFTAIALLSHLRSYSSAEQAMFFRLANSNEDARRIIQVLLQEELYKDDVAIGDVLKSPFYQNAEKNLADFNSIHLGPVHITVDRFSYHFGKDDEYVKSQFYANHEYHPQATLETMLAIDHVDRFYEEKKAIAFTGATASRIDLCWQNEHYPRILHALGTALARNLGNLERESGLSSLVSAGMYADVEACSADITPFEGFIQQREAQGDVNPAARLVTIADTNTDVCGTAASGWTGPGGCKLAVEAPYDLNDNNIKEKLLLSAANNGGIVVSISGGPTTAHNLMRLLLAKNPVGIVVVAAANNQYGTSGFNGLLNSSRPIGFKEGGVLKLLECLYNIACEDSPAAIETGKYQQKVATLILHSALGSIEGLASGAIDGQNFEAFKATYDNWASYKADLSGVCSLRGVELVDHVRGTIVAAQANNLLQDPQQCVTIVGRDGLHYPGASLTAVETEVMPHPGFDNGMDISDAMMSAHAEAIVAAIGAQALRVQATRVDHGASLRAGGAAIVMPAPMSIAPAHAAGGAAAAPTSLTLFADAQPETGSNDETIAMDISGEQEAVTRLG